MEYVFLIYSDENAPSSPELEQEMRAAHGVYGQMLEQHGGLRGGAALHPGATATVLHRPAAGDPSERLVPTDRSRRPRSSSAASIWSTVPTWSRPRRGTVHCGWPRRRPERLSPGGMRRGPSCYGAWTKARPADALRFTEPSGKAVQAVGCLPEPGTSTVIGATRSYRDALGSCRNEAFVGHRPFVESGQQGGPRLDQAGMRLGRGDLQCGLDRIDAGCELAQRPIRSRCFGGGVAGHDTQPSEQLGQRSAGASEPVDRRAGCGCVTRHSHRRWPAFEFPDVTPGQDG